MTEHQEEADRAERELEDMQERSDRLEDEIRETRDDWERQKRDPTVPTGETPRDAEDEQPPPEADFTSRGR